MSYARFGPDSEVYVYAHVDGGWKCEMCALVPWPEPSPRFATLAEMRAHLEEHLEAGYKVPQDCLEQIDREMAGK